MSDQASVPSIEELAAWLKTKHCELWGDFLIFNDEGRMKAGEWLREQMVQAIDHALAARRTADPEYGEPPCSCDGCWACAGSIPGCTCDVDWDLIAERRMQWEHR